MVKRLGTTRTSTATTYWTITQANTMMPKTLGPTMNLTTKHTRAARASRKVRGIILLVAKHLRVDNARRADHGSIRQQIVPSPRRQKLARIQHQMLQLHLHRPPFKPKTSGTMTTGASVAEEAKAVTGEKV